MALAGRMLAADPHFVLGHCFKGYLLLSASNPAFRAEIATTLAAAEAGAAVGWPPRHRRRDHRRGNPELAPYRPRHAPAMQLPRVGLRELAIWGVRRPQNL